MAYTLKVTSSRKEFFQADDCERIIVDFELISSTPSPDNEAETIEIKEQRSLAFPLETTEEDIKTALKKYLDNYNSEADAAIMNKEKDQINKTANSTINALEGLQI